MSRTAAEILGIILTVAGLTALVCGIAAWSLAAAAVVVGSIVFLLGLGLVTAANRGAER